MEKVKAAMTIAIVVGMGIPSAYGQFHGGKKASTASHSRVGPSVQQPQYSQPNTAFVPQVSRSSSAYDQVGQGYAGGDMILSDAKRESLGEWKVGLNRLHGKHADVWGRAIHHPDGSFTVSEKRKEQQTMVQTTKSKSGVDLQKRVINLDRHGNPQEVMIYDGRGTFKYRGNIVYDQFDRLAEEQLFDTEGTLIRRKIQEYTFEGLKLPVRSVDYVENVPSDLQLVVTRQALEEAERKKASQNGSKKRGLFGQQNQQGVQNRSQRPSTAGAAGNSSSEDSTKKRGFGLKRLFGNK